MILCLMYHFPFLSPSVGLWLSVPSFPLEEQCTQSPLLLHCYTLHKALLMRAHVLTWWSTAPELTFFLGYPTNQHDQKVDYLASSIQC